MASLSDPHDDIPPNAKIGLPSVIADPDPTATGYILITSQELVGINHYIISSRFVVPEAGQAAETFLCSEFCQRERNSAVTLCDGRR